ncbi:glycosyltransferase involved in cell wall biosynthesis [Roseimicrobium gellanilyticum]|uniref:Glycosyltransferase involved in cell wall biosynthesis n=1 Tax=Roseimicrobium gellanilyticum TaxID=748857 RepID=A0A366HVH4_9BACT|nr:glycosyltransferase [Roseimicrobium gellanilyticum]RBP48097.1 glycosyltransferase involved in cell wall biosynthesis [Roseimicrobium gellanilyticum]
MATDLTPSRENPSGLRILFVSNLFPDEREPYRGLDNATVLKALQQWKGCEVRVLSPRPSLPLLPAKEWRARVEDLDMGPRFVRTGYVPKVGSLINHRWMKASLSRPLAETHRRFPWDVVLASWLYPDGWAAVNACTRYKAPVVLIAQGSDVHRYLHMPARRTCILDAVAESAGVITRSKSLATLLADAGADRAKLVPITNGIDTAVFKFVDKGTARQTLNVPPEARVLLYVGNFLPVKNPLMLVKAFEKLCAQRGNEHLRLVMVGKGPLQGEVQAAVARAGLAERVHLTGPLSSAKVAEWMQAADVFCMTSRNEGLPNVILEAQACGLPVVATAVGSIPELVDEPWKGGLAASEDVDGWVGEAGRVLLGPMDKLRIAGLGATRTWQSAAERYFEVLQGAVRGSGNDS